jgi:hypothetical protein
MRGARTFGLLLLAATVAACAGGREDGSNGAAEAAATVSAPATDAQQASGNAQGSTAPELRLGREALLAGQPGLDASATLAFGRSRHQVVDAVAAIRGPPTATGRNAECPSGAVDYARFGSLTLHFDESGFAGWVVDGAAQPPLRTEQGIGIGSRRSELGKGDQEGPTVENGSLGPEFSLNGIGGILDGDGHNARITSLFSGVTCFAR